jgi:hypothetical protein
MCPPRDSNPPPSVDLFENRIFPKRTTEPILPPRPRGGQWLTVFIIYFSLFKILVTLFSFYNISVIFQNYINYILHNILDHYCTVYFNNILVFFRTWAEYTRYINKIICCLRAAKLQIDISKSKFYIKKKII